MSLETKEVVIEIGGKKKRYVINEMSMEDHELFGAFLEKNKIKDGVQTVFVMMSFCVKHGGKRYFKKEDYKTFKKTNGAALLNRLMSEVVALNNFSAIGDIEKNS